MKRYACSAHWQSAVGSMDCSGLCVDDDGVSALVHFCPAMHRLNLARTQVRAHARRTSSTLRAHAELQEAVVATRQVRCVCVCARSIQVRRCDWSPAVHCIMPKANAFDEGASSKRETHRLMAAVLDLQRISAWQE
eukprot:6182400-Pleurochrysis_carterae.AAC.1